MDFLIVISGLIFVIIFLGLAGVLYVMQSRQKAKDWSDRVQGRTQQQKKDSNNKEEGIKYIKNTAVKMLEQIGKAGKSKKDDAQTSLIRRTLITAGYRSKSAPIVFIGTKFFLALVLGGLFLVFGSELGFVKKNMSVYFPGGIILCAVVGFYVPQLWLRMMVDKRKERILDGFPDSLDLMVVCVEAGLGLDQAIARVGDEIRIGHEDLGEEFQILSLELRAGLTREQALRNLTQRTDVEEIRSLVALLVQTDRFGTSIGQALRVHSDSMRMNRRLRAEELAAKLPVKLMVPLILFIFPSLLVVIIGPGAIRLVRNLLPAMGGG